ncbi:MAG: hypothetical protein HVN35_04320 [Methanobacteriaceae archaeon]|nr:hypothetical protein [Methanobacteriaceae archaeon]
MNVARARGEKLHTVRLDTPSSRRGDFTILSVNQDGNWILEASNMGEYYVSGSIKEEEIGELNPSGCLWN